MATETELAYIAGLFDGEGCIHIEKRHPSLKQRTVNPQYILQIAITNGDILALQWIQGELGCKLKLQNPKLIREGYKPTWKWYASAKEAYRVLIILLPFLRIKDKEAKEAIAFQEFLSKSSKGYGGKPKPQCELRVLDEAYRTLREYKQQGRYSCVN